MFLRSGKITDFKMLTHVADIRKVEFSDLDRTTLIAGKNGIGKSTMLSELVPFPSTSTSYNKDGGKELVYEHNGDTYTISSDFSSKTPHSFKKNGEELNHGGTTDAQMNLISTHLGYTPTIDKIVSGQNLITRLSRVERRTLIMSTYPSDLTFVLDRYKKIKSVIGELNANIKMLEHRRVELINKMRSEEDILELKKQEASLKDTLSLLDRHLYKARTEIDHFQKYTNSLKDLDLGLIIKDARAVFESLKELYHHRKEFKLLSDDSIQLYEQQLKNYRVQYKNDTDRAYTLRQELGEYQRQAALDTEHSLEECLSNIKKFEEQLKELNFSGKLEKVAVPLTEDYAIEISETIIPELAELLQRFTNLGGKCWTPDKTQRAQRIIEQYQMKVDNYQQRCDDIRNTLSEIKTRKSRMTEYPKDCNRVCALRQTIENQLKNMEKEYNFNKDKLLKLRGRMNRYKSALDRVKTAYLYIHTAPPILGRISSIYPTPAWRFLGLNDEALVNTLNHTPNDLINKLTKIVDQNLHYHTIKKILDKLELLYKQKDALEKTNLPAKALIKNTIQRQENELALLDNSVKTLKQQYQQLKGYLSNSKEFTDLKQRTDTILENFEEAKTKYICNEELEIAEDIYSFLKEKQRELISRQNDIESIIKEQDSLATRLNDEILPILKSKKLELAELEEIESALSPINGFPHLYLIRYINDLITIANEFIRKVWDYDMELAYIQSEDTLDFTLKFIINKNSEVKDVSLGSKSQQTIINLAFNLAFCIYRKYSEQYPIKLDEIDDGLSPYHLSRLTQFLADIVHHPSIKQSFIVNHHVIVSAGFNDAGVIALSDAHLVEQDKLKSKIE